MSRVFFKMVTYLYKSGPFLQHQHSISLSQTTTDISNYKEFSIRLNVNKADDVNKLYKNIEKNKITFLKAVS